MGSKGDPLNCFALVTYIPEPLGSFLNRLREELVPGYLSQAHVTILPPRPLFVDTSIAKAAISSKLPGIAPFEVEATEVHIFPETDVIHISIGKGRPELLHLHDTLNAGPIGFEEPFPYHPHITLAQELDLGQVRHSYEIARRLWAEFSGSRKFAVDSVTLVQNATDNDWIDLAKCRLGGRK